MKYLDGSLSSGGGELAPNDRPHLALPRPLVLLGHAPDVEAALGVPRQGGGGQAARLPGPPPAHCVDGPVGRSPQADAGPLTRRTQQVHLSSFLFTHGGHSLTYLLTHSPLPLLPSLQSHRLTSFSDIYSLASQTFTHSLFRLLLTRFSDSFSFVSQTFTHSLLRLFSLATQSLTQSSEVGNSLSVQSLLLVLNFCR